MRIFSVFLCVALLGSLGASAQTNQPLPPDAQPLTALTYLSPSDSTVWLYNERSSLAINVGVWADVQELFNQKWSNTQIDSAITSRLAGYVRFWADIPDKPSVFPPTAHTHSANDINSDVLAIARIPTGTTGSTVALGNDSRIVNAVPNSRTVNSKSLSSDITLSASDVGALATGANISLLTNDAGYISSIPTNFITNSNLASPVSLADWPSVDLGSNTGASIFRTSAIGITGAPTTDGTYSYISMYGAPTSSPLIAIQNGGSGYNGSLYFRNRASVQWHRVATEAWATANFSASEFTRSTAGLVPAPGGSGTTRYLREDGSWTVPAGGGGGTATDLSLGTRTTTTMVVGSSTGAGVTLPSATTTLAGLMSADAMDQVANLSNNYITTYSNQSVGGNKTLTGVANFTGGLRENGTEISSIYVPQTRTVTAGNHLFGGGALGGDISLQLRFDLGSYINDSESNPRLYFGNSTNANNIIMRLSNPSGSWQLRGSANETLFAINQSGTVTVGDVPYARLSGVPSTFAPSPHTHSVGDVIGLPTATLIGKYSSGTGPAETLTAAQARALLNVANGATANSSDATLLNRANHTGTQAISTVSGLQTALDAKATSGTGPTQVRNNSQLDARYLQSVSGGSGVNVSGSTISVDNTVIRTTGNQTKSGTLGVTNIMGTSTTASSSIPTNAQSVFTASVSSNTSYTLTNLTGSPRHIQVVVTNTGSSDIFITFNGAKLSISQSNRVDEGTTAIFTFLVNNGSAYGTKTLFQND